MKYIKRTYRITTAQDRKVKKLKRLANSKAKSESGVIRDLINNIV